MVTAETRPGAANVKTEPSDYSPGKVAHWLINWGELRELAVPTVGAIPYDANSRCHSTAPHEDYPYCTTMVDIERAWANLPGGRWSLEHTIAEWVMHGYEIRTVEDILRIGHGSGQDAFRRACVEMAHYLGYEC